MDLKTVIASNLKRLREASELSREELASKLELSVTGIHTYESGQRFPRPEVIEAMAAFFKVPFSEFFKSEDEQKIIPMSMNQAFHKALCIPNEVYDMAQKVSIDNPCWEAVLIALEVGVGKEAEKKIKSSPSDL